MQAIGWVCVALLVPAFSGCLTDDAAPEARDVRARGVVAAPRTANLAVDLHEGLHLTVVTQGTGWGRLDFVAEQEMQLDVAVTNGRFNLTDMFPGGEARSIYNEFNHTLIYVYLESDRPRNPANYFFEWIGYPVFSRPRTPDLFQTDVGPFPLPAGAKGAVLVATTVPGYNVTLQAGKVDATETMKLSLNPRDGYVFSVPKPTETAILNQQPARIQRDRSWVVDPIEVAEPSLFLFQAWTVQEGNVVFAGLTQDEVRVTGMPNSQPALPLPASGSGGATGSSRSYTTFLEQPTSVDAYRRLVQTHVGMYETGHAGISVIVLPVT